jgi:hypothetical protein
MAEDIRQNFGTEQSVTITGLDGLANGSSAVSNAIDLGSPGPFAITLKAELEGASASNTGTCDIYLKWSHDNAKFPDDGNDALVGVVQMNGAAGVIRSLSVPVRARYLKVRVENNSGAALVSGSPAANDLKYVPRSVDQV